jgi:hypothetical protein
MGPRMGVQSTMPTGGNCTQSIVLGSWANVNVRNLQQITPLKSWTLKVETYSQGHHDDLVRAHGGLYRLHASVLVECTQTVSRKDIRAISHSTLAYDMACNMNPTNFQDQYSHCVIEIMYLYSMYDCTGINALSTRTNHLS